MDSVVNQLASNEACFPKLRRVQNYIPTSENLLGSGGGGASMVVSGKTLTANVPTGVSGPYYYLNSSSGFSLGRVLVATAMVTGPAGRIICLRLANNGAGSNAGVTQVSCTGAPQRVTVSVVTSTVINTFSLGLDARNIFTPPCNIQTGDVFTLDKLQIEDVTGNLNQVPSEYVSTGVLSYPYHGTGVDGTQYFTTRNGNAVQQNLVTNSQNFSNAAWAPTTASVTTGVTDPLGGTTAATVTALANASYLVQTVTGQTLGQYVTATIWLRRRTGTGTVSLASVQGGYVNLTLTSSWQSFSSTGQINTLTNGYVALQLATSGDQVDVAFGQYQPGEVASTYVPTTTAAVNNSIVESYAGTPINLSNPLIGLRAWGARTNSIRNNTMTGGGAGTAPTNWVLTGASGLTWTVIGTGTENGIPYTEFQLSGTPNATGYALIAFDSNTQVAASAGQIWVASSFIKLSAGSVANALFALQINAFASSTQIGNADSNPVPTSAAIGTQRTQTLPYTLPATTTSVMSELVVTLNASAPVNFNIRIGAPQLEQVVASTDVASDVIFTTSAAVTCAQDLCSGTPSINASQGTLQVEYALNQAANTVATASAAMLHDGTQNNRVLLANFNATGQIYVTAATVAQQAALVGAVPPNAVHRSAVVYGIANSDACVDAGTVVAGTGATPPTGMTTLTLGSQIGGTYPLFGVVRNVHVYPRAANDAQLKVITGVAA
jgi:hypothetical protein